MKNRIAIFQYHNLNILYLNDLEANWIIAISSANVLYFDTVEAYCTIPVPPANISIALADIDLGGTLTYACYHGFAHVHGNLTHICNVSAQWEGATPVCEGTILKY